MASDVGFVDYVCEQAGLGAALSYRRMFGEYALYLDDRVVALVCDNMLFVKPTEAGRALLDAVDEAPPYPGARMHWRMDAVLDDGERLGRLLRATAAALPLPKPRAPRKARAKG
ncbi:TfoX/Sxy family protein [Dyella sp.]|jgi:TfoX/Sxy family transcriptional regulator of competence genes|uniref:TfoX/Sxy family protein n=1 Tax=Dyella sp. TaxID=1869338 RepID=UPI002D769B58|nr:TfoX/Sxy family protein [Dyella sp.]HET6432720.1 TfoX/Sxy family protein [Dyella sp.]